MPRRPKAVGAAAVLLFAALSGCRRSESPAAAPSASAPAATPGAPPAEAVESSDGARTARPAGGKPAVIWIGLDGLDWELLDRLSAEGKMPNWKRLVAEGSSGKIASFLPILSPVVWTTAATGVGPDVHRVLDFQEVDARTGQKVPISGFSRAVPAIWNLASAAGRRVGVVGFWATHPAEQVDGFFVSDRASPILFEKLPLAGVAYPSSLEAGVAQVVARDGRVGAADLAPYLDMPEDAITSELGSGAGMENKVVALSRILAATRVYQRVARDLYDRDHPDLMALYLEGTDEVGHVFGTLVPPRLACVSDEDFHRYSRAVDVYYAAIDRILGQWMRRASEDGATLVVHSDHGFKWGAERPCERSSLNWSTAAYWHRLDGVYAFWGKGVRPSPERGKASIFDVAPTILGLLGLPADTRMGGHALGRVIDGKIDVARRDLFPGVTVRRVAAEAISPEQASEYAKKLLALGYLSGSETRPLAPTGGDAPGMTEGAWNNLGLYEREQKNFSAAKAAFEKSLALRPDYHSPMFNLAVMYREQHQLPLAEDWLFRAFAAGHADPEGTIDNWATVYRVEKRPADEVRLLERGRKLYPASERLAQQLALARFRAHDCPGAESALAPLEATTNNTDTLNALALVRTCLGKTDDARKLFERSLQIKPDQPGVIKSLDLLRAAQAVPVS
jgi:predicted AlkP superfamily phosphohydrolase/phosphomutase/Flp pilus assembly protein TadD